MRRVEDLISECTRTKHSRSVIKSIVEESLSNPRELCKPLVQDLKVHGHTVKQLCVEEHAIHLVLHQKPTPEAHQVIDTYSRIYPWVDIFLG